MHKFMKMAGCNTEEEFYQKYPSEKAFFAAYPHMKGNQTMKNGGAASGHPGSYWNGDTWVSTKGDSGTYSNGVYYGNGGATFPIGGSAPIFGMGGSASFNISNNDYPSPFAMAPGTGMGSGYLQDLPTHMAHGGHIPGADIIDPFAMYPGTGSGGGMLQDLPTEMKKGGIHIAPSKRGTFTAAATKHGKSVQAFASQVLANKENYSPAMVKKANFARNAAKWHHEYGGQIMQMGGYPNPALMTPYPTTPVTYDSIRNQPNIPVPISTFNDPTRRIKNLVDIAAQEQAAAADNAIRKQWVNKAEQYYTIDPVTGKPMPKKAYGGYYENGGKTMPDNPGFRALPSAVQQKIMDNMQTGGMVTDDRMIYGPGGQYMQTGGMINPYHPMAKFLRGGYYQGGGMFGPDGRNAEDETEVPAYTSPTTVSNPSDDPNIAANTGVVQQNPDPADNAAWRQGMTDQQAQENIKYGKNSVQAYDPLTGDTTDDQYNKVERQNRNAARNQKWQNVSNWGNAILGTGMTALGIGRAYKNKRDAENSRNKQFNDGSSANKLFAMNQPGDKGDYTQQGIFRPDSMTPTAAGKFYPGMAGSYNQGMGITKYGGGVMNNYTYAHGGYHAGQEVELSDAEIANLKRMGYQFDIL